MRVMLALGGNAMTNAEGRARPEDQIAAAHIAMRAVAEVLRESHEVVITHGNGPQVGNLLVKNEIAAGVVPPVPLDWCVAQTQATLGYIMMNALAESLDRIGLKRACAALVTRTLIDANDPAFAQPSKPIGRYLSAEQAQVLIEHGERWEDRGEHGWRRVVPSPEPRDILDLAAIEALVAAGLVVIAAGGGGIGVRPDLSGGLIGVEAVIDKDLTACLLGCLLDADLLVVATDVPAVMLNFGGPDARPLGEVGVGELREHARQGQFAAGSMAPKVEAACRFVERTGHRAVITDLDSIAAAVSVRPRGTCVVPDQPTRKEAK